MRKLLNILTSRFCWVVGLTFFQVGLIALWIFVLGPYYWTTTIVSMVIGLFLIMHICRQNDNPAYKMAWCILILLIPVVGIVCYLIYGRVNVNKGYRKKHEKMDQKLLPMLEQDPKILKEIERENPHIAGQFRYLKNSAGYPVTYNEYSHYFSSGEEYYVTLLEQLEKAKKFIFLEYFIIERASMWFDILNILERKAKEGVEVRLLYDDVGSVWLLPRDYPEQMRRLGIKCRVFNRISIRLSAIYNNRDHRKIAIIDGECAFCGGLNLANEYINRVQRFGHWKDGGIFVTGEAVWNYTIMYLSMWNAMGELDYDYQQYHPKQPVIAGGMRGYVCSYGDSPLDNECTSENVYLNIIHNAKRYIYITTPYLILDREMQVALCLAAKNGVDVRIMTPHIPDKKTVFMLTRSNYTVLMRAGVRIFEYGPGFIHTKAFVADDEIAAIGSINLDFRSLYLHFECGSLLYRTEAVMELKHDFERTQEADGIEFETNFWPSMPLWQRAFVSFVNLFAPLL